MRAEGIAYGRAFSPRTSQIITVTPGKIFLGDEAVELLSNASSLVKDTTPSEDKIVEPVDVPNVDVEDSSSVDETYDPSDHTVAEVLEYVKEHPDMEKIVLELEVDGRHRKVIINALS